MTFLARTILMSLFFVIIAVSNAFPADRETELLQSHYNFLNEIEGIGNISIHTNGSAEKLGLNQKKLTAFAVSEIKKRLEKKYLLSWDRFTEAYTNKEIAKQVGTIIVNIKTEGEDYPVAYQIHFIAGTLLSSPYEKSVAGTSSGTSIPQIVNKTITAMIDDFLKIFNRVKSAN